MDIMIINIFFVQLVDWINKALSTETGSGAFVVTLLAILVFVVWKVARAVMKVEGIDNFNERFDRFESKIEGKLDDIKQGFHTLNARLTLQEAASSTGLTQSQSPIKLNSKGIKLRSELKADEVLEKYWGQVLDFLNKSLDVNSTPYDVQLAAFEYAPIMINTLFSETEKQDIKQAAYENGYSLNVFDSFYAILIRDRYFSENNIEVEEVDDHDPTNKVD